MTKKDSESFSRKRLEEVLETMSHWWHRHGDEDLEDVQNYVRNLYRNLPANLYEDSYEEKMIEVDFEYLRAQLGEVLRKTFSAEELRDTFKAQELEADLDSDVGYIRSRLGVLNASADPVRVKAMEFEEVYDELYGSESFTDEAAAQLSTLRDKICTQHS